MDPNFLRAMADFLENPEEVTLQARQAKDHLFELAAKFDQEKPRVNNEDMGALVYGIVVTLASPLEILERMDGMQLIVQMAHWLGKKEGRSLGYKQARAEQLFRPVKLHKEEK